MSANNQKQKTDLQVDQQIDQLASGIPPLHLSTKFPSDFPFQMPEVRCYGDNEDYSTNKSFNSAS